MIINVNGRINFNDVDSDIYTQIGIEINFPIVNHNV